MTFVQVFKGVGISTMTLLQVYKGACITTNTFGCNLILEKYNFAVQDLPSRAVYLWVSNPL